MPHWTLQEASLKGVTSVRCGYGQTFRPLRRIGLLGIITHTVIQYTILSVSHTRTYTHHLRGFLNHQAGKLNSIDSLNEFLSPSSNPGASHLRSKLFLSPSYYSRFFSFVFSLSSFTLKSHHLGFSFILCTLLYLSLHRISVGFRKSDFILF